MGGLSPSGKAVSLRAWPGIRFPEGFLVDSDSTGLRPVRQAHWPVVERVPSGRVYNLKKWLKLTLDKEKPIRFQPPDTT